MKILLYANPIVNAYLGSDFFGKVIFLALFALSIATWIVFLQKFASQRSCRRLAQPFQQKYTYLDHTLKAGNHPFGHLYTTLQKTTRPLLEKQPALAGPDIEYIRAHLQQAVSNEVTQMEKRISLLSTVVSLAPFLGLLGTVWGILLTFSELQAGASANANATVMGGLAMALGTTVLGLLVAIPALVSYNYLRASIRHLSQEMEDFSNLLIASVERHYRR